MRFNFKKITAILSSAIMVGSSLGLAAAADYPSPFIVGGTANVAIVYGTGPGVSATDQTASWNTALDLQSRMGESSTVSTVCSGGDCYLFELASTRLNINDTLNGVKSSALDEIELPTLLAEGTYSSGDSQDYGYSQEVRHWNSGLTFTSFADKDYDDEKPHVGIHVNRQDFVLNYSIIWKTQPKSDVSSAGRLEDFEASTINILGKEYTILNAYNKSITGNTKLELMGGAYVGTVDEGNTVPVALNGKTYAVRSSFNDGTKSTICVTIDSGVEECKTNMKVGETWKVSDGTQIGVRGLNYRAKAGTTDSVDFSLGAEKLTIENAQALKINDVETDGVTTYITQTASSSQEQLGNIVMRWQAKEEYFVTDNNEVTVPGLGRIKLSSGGFTTPASEEIKVANSGSQRMELVIPIKDGIATIPILYGNTTAFTYIGSDSTKHLVTPNWANMSAATPTILVNTSSGASGYDEYFVASWNSSTDAESYLLSVATVTASSGVNYTTINNQVTGTQACKVKSGDDCKIGNTILSTTNAWDADDSVLLTINAGGSFNRVYSKEGAVFYLPVYGNDSITDAGGLINPSYINVTGFGDVGVNVINGNNATSWALQMREEDRTGNLGIGKNVTMVLDWASGKAEVKNIYALWASDSKAINNPDLQTEDSSEKYTDWVLSDLATQVTFNQLSGSQYSADIVYHGGESYGSIYIADADAVIPTAGTAAATTTTGVMRLGDIVVKDSEVSSVKDKNLIIIGGSCINSAAATVLGGAYCGATFTEKTGIGTGQFLIKSVKDAYATDKIALVVAGYDLVDTQNAQKFLTTQKVDTAAGKIYKGTSATTAELQVA